MQDIDTSSPEAQQVLSAHIELYQTDPASALMWDTSVAGGPGPLPTLLLETFGRKSRESRPRPLLFTEYSGGYVVAASSGGAPTNPIWYLNLEAMKSVGVRVGADIFEAEWRLLSDEERQEVWPIMVESYPLYAEYQKRTSRVMPLLLLTRK